LNCKVFNSNLFRKTDLPKNTSLHNIPYTNIFGGMSKPYQNSDDSYSIKNKHFTNISLGRFRSYPQTSKNLGSKGKIYSLGKPHSRYFDIHYFQLMYRSLWNFMEFYSLPNTTKNLLCKTTKINFKEIMTKTDTYCKQIKIVVKIFLFILIPESIFNNI